MGFFRKAGAAHRGFLPTRCHWNCLKCLEQTTPNFSSLEHSYKCETWTKLLSSSALPQWTLQGNPDWSTVDGARCIFWHGFGENGGETCEVWPCAWRFCSLGNPNRVKAIWLGGLQKKSRVLQKMCHTLFWTSSGPVLGWPYHETQLWFGWSSHPPC